MPTFPSSAIYREFAVAARLTVNAKLFPAVKPPANVDVAAVEVAMYRAAVGVEVETSAPLPLIAVSMWVPSAEKIGVFVKVCVPAQVLEVVVPKASERCEPAVPRPVSG